LVAPGAIDRRQRIVALEEVAQALAARIIGRVPPRGNALISSEQAAPDVD
jgi:hypothetical protein